MALRWSGVAYLICLGVFFYTSNAWTISTVCLQVANPLGGELGILLSEPVDEQGHRITSVQSTTVTPVEFDGYKAAEKNAISKGY